MATTKADLNSQAADIIDGVGGAGNVKSLTHCATRLRFELNDASLADKDRLEANPKVMGAVPQGGAHYQVIVGGDVATVYNAIQNLPEFQDRGTKSNEDVKAEQRAKAKGKVPWIDAFFEYLSDSFRPILGVLLGASLIIAFAAVMDAFKLVDFQATVKTPTWQFVDAMWRSVFYFLPVMVAYNAGKKLNIDGWVPAAQAISRFYRTFDAWFGNKTTPENGFLEPSPESKFATRPEFELDSLHKTAMIGTPDEVIERIGHYRDLGVDEYSFWCDNSLSHEEKKRSLALFIEHVVPAFR